MTIVSPDELRAWLDVPDRIDSGDVPLLDQVLASAVEAVAEYTDRAWSAPEVSTRIFDGGYASVDVDDFTSATLVEESHDRASWTARTDWWAEPPNDATHDLIRSSRPFAQWVRVTASFGRDEVPAAVRQAVLMVAARLWSRRRSASGVEGAGEFGVIRITRAEDPDVAALLGPHRRYVGVIA